MEYTYKNTYSVDFGSSVTVSFSELLPGLYAVVNVDVA